MTSPVTNNVKAAAILMVAVTATACVRNAADRPLFAQPQDVPSVSESAPSAQWAAAIARARPIVRAAIVEQNLPGVSVAVGIGLPSVALAKEGLPSEALAKEGTIVWAEGFGWRDVDTRTPVTPNTRFNIGTAASAVTAAAVAPLGLANTGAEAAAAWSPEHIGEPEEDFPPLTMIRHAILQPIGLAAAEYPLPGDRATFYVPRSDGNPLRGRRLMYMRDLACCAGAMASYSTASDLVRFGLANGGSVNGELAGGMVMSLMTLRDSGIVVAVLSNIAHANTSALGLKIGDAFSNQPR
jgi:CubicO group peptidase (beta-lactamase class C family)